MKTLLLPRSPIGQSLYAVLKSSGKLDARTIGKFLKLRRAFSPKQILPPEFYDYSGNRTGFGTATILGINSQKIPYVSFPGTKSVIVPATSELLENVTEEVRKRVTTPVSAEAATTREPPSSPTRGAGTQTGRQAKIKKRAMVLLHGWNGTGQDTWKEFPKLLEQDFPDDRILLYNYPTSLWGTVARKKYPTPAQIAEVFRTFLENELSDCDSVILLAHSLGGVIARKFLVDEIKEGRAETLTIRALILYGSPFNGSEWDGVVKALTSSSSQPAYVRADSEFLMELQADWSKHIACLDWEVGSTSQLAVPTYAVVGAQDTTVSERSASFYTNRIRKVMKDHQGLVKPKDKHDEVYKTTLTLLKKVTVDLSTPRTNKTCP